MAAARPLIRISYSDDSWHPRHRRGELVSRSGRVLEDVSAPRVSYRKGGEDAPLKLEFEPLATIVARQQVERQREAATGGCRIGVRCRRVRFGPLAPLQRLKPGDMVVGRPVIEGEALYPPEELIGTLCFAAGVERAHLNGRSRADAIVKPRQIGLWLVKRFTPRSLPAIGRLFGDRDHSTVLYAVARVDSVIAALGLTITDDPAEAIRTLLAARWPAPRKLRRA